MLTMLEQLWVMIWVTTSVSNIPPTFPRRTRSNPSVRHELAPDTVGTVVKAVVMAGVADIVTVGATPGTVVVQRIVTGKPPTTMPIMHMPRLKIGLPRRVRVGKKVVERIQVYGIHFRVLQKLGLPVNVKGPVSLHRWIQRIQPRTRQRVVRVASVNMENQTLLEENQAK